MSKLFPAAAMAAFLFSFPGVSLQAQTNSPAGPQDLVVVLSSGQEHRFAMSQVARIEFRGTIKAASPVAVNEILRPGTFVGTYRNTLGHSGPDKLRVDRVNGATVRGIWSGRPFEATLRGRTLDFVQPKVSNCKDYKVRLEFSADWGTATVAYSVTDRCGPHYSGSQTLRRQ
jgi:hypothetical protein